MIKTNTVYIEVDCSERLPNKEAYFYTNLGSVYFDKQIDRVGWRFPNKPDWWLDKREDQVIMSKEDHDKALARDKSFLSEMYQLSQDLLNDKFCGLKLDQLNQMISDWKAELERK